jgi:uncharacterized protein
VIEEVRLRSNLGRPTAAESSPTNHDQSFRPYRRNAARSKERRRASHNIGRYLARNGYRIFPVNPALTEILGEPCYPNLDAAQATAQKLTGKGIDLVDVFRASEHVPPIVDDVIRLKIPYLWLQDEVTHDEAVARARAAGVKCIQNDCIFREHAKRVSESAG